jgi:hypothetical protein
VVGMEEASTVGIEAAGMADTVGTDTTAQATTDTGTDTAGTEVAIIRGGCCQSLCQFRITEDMATGMDRDMGTVKGTVTGTKRVAAGTGTLFRCRWT